MKETFESMEVPVTIPNFDETGAAARLMVKVPVRRDPQTGEALMTDEGLRRVEEARRQYMKLLSPTQIRDLRKRMGLTQIEMATLLQAGRKNFSRWESGRAQPSRLVNVLLRAVYDGALTLDYLRSLQPGAPEAGAVSAAPRQWEAAVPAVARRPVASAWQGILQREVLWKQEGPVSLLDTTTHSFGKLISVRACAEQSAASDRADLACAS